MEILYFVGALMLWLGQTTHKTMDIATLHEKCFPQYLNIHVYENIE